MNLNLCSCIHFKKSSSKVKRTLTGREGGKETIKCWVVQWLVILEQLLRLLLWSVTAQPAVAQPSDWLDTVCCCVHVQTDVSASHAAFRLSLILLWDSARVAMLRVRRCRLLKGIPELTGLVCSVCFRAFTAFSPPDLSVSNLQGDAFLVGWYSSSLLCCQIAHSLFSILLILSSSFLSSLWFTFLCEPFPSIKLSFKVPMKSNLMFKC